MYYIKNRIFEFFIKKQSQKILLPFNLLFYIHYKTNWIFISLQPFNSFADTNTFALYN